MSGVIQKETAIAAAGSNDNLFSGSAFEYLRGPSVVSAGVLASATGTFITFQVGPTVVLEESPPAVGTAMPKVPDDFTLTAAGVTGDRIVLRARNPTAGSITFRAIAQISDV